MRREPLSRVAPAGVGAESPVPAGDGGPPVGTEGTAADSDLDESLAAGEEDSICLINTSR